MMDGQEEADCKPVVDEGGGIRLWEAMYPGNPEDSLGSSGDWLDVKEEPQENSIQQWETQWQEYLSIVELTPSGAPQEPTPWDDAPAFLASFEQVAEAYRWPKEEWAARLLPALGGEAKQAFKSLEGPDREDYGKVKAAILQGDTMIREKHRQHFRRFSYQEAEGPRGVYTRLQELCYRWLKVERHTKEEILELLVLEQFLAVLPPEMQNWMKGHCLESSTHAVTLAEDFLIRHLVPERREEQVAALPEEGSMSLQETKSESEEDGIDFDFETVPEDGSENSYPEENGQENHSHEMGPWGVSAERAKDCSPQYWKEEEVLENNCRVEQVIYLRGDGQRSILHEEVDKKASVTVILQRTTNGESSGKASQNPGKLHNCSHCEKVFSCPKQLRKHLILHSDGIPLKNLEIQHTGEKCECPDCGERFSESSSLDSHRKEVHQETKPSTLPKYVSGAQKKCHPCPECGRTFDRPSRLIRHQVVHTREKPCKSAGPGVWGTQSSSLDSQRKKIRRGRKVAPLLTKSPSTQPSQCCECGKSFPNPSHLIRHCVQAGEQLYKCTDCGDRSLRSSCLDQHRKEIHQEMKASPLWVDSSGGQKNRHQCSECGKKLSDSSSLKAHQRIHTGNKPYRCADCGEHFMWGSSFIRHRQKAHQGQKVVPLPPNVSSRPGSCLCPECGLECKWISQLIRHRRIHTGEKPYKCANCGESFRWKQTLAHHGRSCHAGMKWSPRVPGASPRHPKHGKPFSKTSHLIRRREIHAKKSSHVCAECGKSFGRALHLAAHQKTHAPKQQHRCSDCGRSFDRPSRLARHQKISLERKHYQCPQCEESFVCRASFEKHKTSHSEVQDLENGSEQLAEALSATQGNNVLQLGGSPE